MITRRLLLGLLAIAPTAAAAGEAGRLWAQKQDMTPRQRQWFRDQKRNDSAERCCDEADGEQVQEDIRDGVYYVKCATTEKWTEDGWMRVPPERVLNGPNMWGQPICWFRNKDAGPWVACYSPGVKS